MLVGVYHDKLIMPSVLLFTCLHLLFKICGVHCMSLRKEVASTKNESKIMQTAAELWQRCQDLGLNRTLNYAGELEKKAVISFKYVKNARFVMCDLPYSGSDDWLKSTEAARYAYEVDRGKLTMKSKSSLKERMDEFNYRLMNYHTVLTIRHPFERLVAIYKHNNKLEHFKQEKILDHIKAIRSYIILLQIQAEKRDGEDFKLSFKQFIGFVLHSPSSSYYWRTLYEICAPCSIRYHDVTSLSWNLERKESLAKRMNVVANSAKLEYVLREHNSTEWVKYYDAITLSDQTKLYDLYKYDFKLFGYHWPIVFDSRPNVTTST